MVPSGGRFRGVFVVAVAVLVVASTSFAFKKFVRGNDPAGQEKTGYLKYADYQGAARPAPGGCSSSDCGVAGGNRRASCCSGRQGGGGVSSTDVEKIRVEALNYYSSKYGDANVTCEVKDYGCHQEAEIFKDGRVVKKFSISGGRIEEII